MPCQEMSWTECFLRSYGQVRRKIQENKQTKPDSLVMVPWYSGYISVISLFIYYHYYLILSFLLLETPS